MKPRAMLLGVTLVVAVAGSLLWMRGRDDPPPARPAPDAEARRPPRRAQGPRDPATVPVTLRDTSWKVRLATANALRTMNALSIPQRAALLAEALDREVAAPASGPPFAGSYVSLTGMLRLQYLALLEGFGAPATDAVRAAGAPATPAGREWRILAIAATGARASAPEVRTLLASSDPVVRMTAARYLGYMGDQAAVPALRRALADPFTASTHSDLEGDSASTFFPVREQAARALRALGLTVERRGHAFTVR